MAGSSARLRQRPNRLGSERRRSGDRNYADPRGRVGGPGCNPASRPRGEHQVRAVFSGQEAVNDEGVVTAVLKPSTSEALTGEVKAHEIEVKDTPAPVTATMVTGDNGGDGDQDRGGSDGSDMGSADGSILRKLLIALGVIAAVMRVLNQS
ncbi:hypothetical protein FRC0028_00293 [Corynebacterium diphtheriae]|nr:hypothetical protein FRC0031_00100 [Corynebacterium diphtheriae]CAB0673904.1 hypothetical protein FRC0037_00101 [Corynebacterium diphtheriae]CAB0673973.1 hypothetical protein FRC0038_00104 [Corynebacterium diphtheriae]CAB0677165.1 hypothetical protein FRC0022_00272 [Corynebacterium diphtheriae]CAB0677415.1 hypothetical protein FRC0081_00289 [Corynebacterium diphtheriae]